MTNTLDELVELARSNGFNDGTLVAARLVADAARKTKDSKEALRLVQLARQILDLKGGDDE